MLCGYHHIFHYVMANTILYRLLNHTFHYDLGYVNVFFMWIVEVCLIQLLKLITHLKHACLDELWMHQNVKFDFTDTAALTGT